MSNKEATGVVYEMVNAAYWRAYGKAYQADKIARETYRQAAVSDAWEDWETYTEAVAAAKEADDKLTFAAGMLRVAEAAAWAARQ